MRQKTKQSQSLQINIRKWAMTRKLIELGKQWMGINLKVGTLCGWRDETMVERLIGGYK